MPTIEGGCFCGAVRYRATTAPKQSMVCHCRSCRRAAAAPAVAWVTFARADFSVTAGELTRYRSSPPVQRGFCSACGTPLTYEHDARAGDVDVTTVSLDDAEAFPPTCHARLAEDLSWVRFGDGLPTYRGWKSEG